MHGIWRTAVRIIFGIMIVMLVLLLSETLGLR